MNYRPLSLLALHHPIGNRYPDLPQRMIDMPPTHMIMHILLAVLVYLLALEHERGRGVSDLEIVRGYPNTTLSVLPGTNRSTTYPVIKIPGEPGSQVKKTNRALRKS